MKRVFNTDFTKGTVIAFIIALLIPTGFLFFFHQGFNSVLKENSLWYSHSIVNILKDDLFGRELSDNANLESLSENLIHAASDSSIHVIMLLDSSNTLLMSSEENASDLSIIPESAWDLIKDQHEEVCFIDSSEKKILTVIPYVKNGIYSGACVIQFDAGMLKHRVKKYYYLVLFLIVVLAVSVFKLLSSVLFYHYRDKRNADHLKDELRESNRMLKQILKTAPAGICLVKNRTFQWINREMLKQFRLSEYDDFIGKSTRIIFESDEAFEEAGSMIYSSGAANCPMCDLEIKAKRKDGTLFPAKVFWNFIDSMDRDKGAIVIIIDASIHKDIISQEIYREKTQALLELAGAVAHELSQPIQYISGVTELAMTEMDKNNPVFRHFEKIITKIDLLNSITEKLKRITRYETKEYVRGKKIVDLDKSAENRDPFDDNGTPIQEN